MPSPKKKVTLYFSSSMLEETQREAIRQDRSISWIIQAAWRMSRDEVKKLPDVAGTATPPASPPQPPVVPPPSRVKARN
ncbi:MAG TPA: TIGR04563 family protein [Polyangia bacterium]|nr:TIGR04563 family protein [Polyangia bacterium]